jgi:RND family efflux transporter MFP subunit
MVVGLAYLGWKNLGIGVQAIEKPLAVAAHRVTLRVIVTERGNLESTVTMDGICELTGHQNKIIQLVPEGTKVKVGDIVCRFDTAEIEKNIAQQDIKSKQAKSKIETQKQEIEIARNKGEGEIKDADVEWQLGKGNLKKYQESDYKAEIFEIQGNIAQHSSKAEEAKVKYDQTKELVKKGFRSPEQLRGAKTEFDQYDFFLKQFTEKLKSKEKYEYALKSLELTSKVEQAEGKKKRAEKTAVASVAKAQSEFDGAVSTFTIEDQQLKEYLSQREKSVLKAQQAGVVAYANDRWYDPSSRIREGAMVYSRQKIYSLPDMTKMQVKVNIHESLVKKVKPGQKAEVRVDAFPNLVLTGVVKSVSPLADSNQSFGGGGSKEYTTYVTIEKLPDEGLKPSMTAEVRIQVSLVNNALVVPLQAVVDHKGDHYAFVEDKRGKIKLRSVKIGETNEREVQILEGLTDGDRVVLDARTRAEIEFKDESEKGTEDKPPSGPSPGTSKAGGGSG